MASNEMMKTEFAFFGEVWTFFKKHYHVRQDDEFWEAAIAECSAINDKYNCELCKSLLIAIMNELDRKGRTIGRTQQSA